MHGQCDARPVVTFPAIGHHCPVAGIKLYCLVTEAHLSVNNLTKAWQQNGESLLRAVKLQASALTITPCRLLAVFNGMGETACQLYGNFFGNTTDRHTNKWQ